MNTLAALGLVVKLIPNQAEIQREILLKKLEILKLKVRSKHSKAKPVAQLRKHKSQQLGELRLWYLPQIVTILLNH